MPVTDFQDFTITLEVAPPPPGNPNPQITQVQVPASAGQGASVPISVAFVNQGALGTCYVEIKDKDTGTIVGSRQSASLGTGASATRSWTLTMPNKNWRLSAEVGY